MKKTIAILATAGLLAASFAGPADAKRKRKPKRIEREAESSYDTPAIGHPDVIVGCSGSTGCATFTVGPKERYATFEITDSLGTPVYAVGGQDLDEDGFADTRFTFCGNTEEPVEIEPSVNVNIFISAGPGMNPPCTGAASSGTVMGTFSNLP
jgi:hypothetical protein